MKLKTLCEQYVKLKAADENITVKGLAIDSRQVKDGYIFFAVPGLTYDGISFIPKAIENGAVAIFCEESMDIFAHVDIETSEGRKVPIYAISHLLLKVGEFASKFYQYPSSHYGLIGVTGTNGKSSIVYFITSALNKLNKKTAMLGTLGNGYVNALETSSHTTLDAVSLQQMLSQFSADNSEYVAMEVSSHGLTQGRINGCNMDIAIFTNLTHEHLDYHGNMHNYGQAKRKLFQMKDLRYAIFNVDDEFGLTLFNEFKNIITCYGLTTQSNHTNIDKAYLISAKNIQQNSQGLSFDVSSPWGQGKIHSSLYGKFNILNLLSTITCLGIVSNAWPGIIKVVETLAGVPGRMQVLQNPFSPTAIIDYAHTPDALKNALLALREHQFGTIWCVFGCGGERDTLKRAMMGKVAQKYADHLIITNDNPRNEAPQVIAEQIRAGITDDDVKIILDRKIAIETALRSANTEDVILIAGKGHEQYQEIGNVKTIFSDESVVVNFWNLDDKDL